jgi:hypothetical protein
MNMDNEESGERWRKVRQLWCQWDPIGVVDGGIEDEYDAYLGPTLRLLEEDTSVEKIAEYLTHVVGDEMSMGKSGIAFSRPAEFAKKLKHWYSETYV